MHLEMKLRIYQGIRQYYTKSEEMKSPELKKNDRLYAHLELQIDRIKRKKHVYSWIYRGSQILIFILGAVITILAGWSEKSIITYWSGKFDLSIRSNDFILLASTSVTLLVAIQGLFDLKDKAASYDVLLFELRKIRSKMAYDFYRDPGLYYSKRNEYFNEFQVIADSQKLIIENSYGAGE
jgi:hypothetical protein